MRLCPLAVLVDEQVLALPQPRDDDRLIGGTDKDNRVGPHGGGHLARHDRQCMRSTGKREIGPRSETERTMPV